MKVLGVKNKDNSYNEVRKLDDEEYNKYKKAIKRIYILNDYLSIYGTVDTNYHAFLSELNSFIPPFTSGQEIDQVIMDQMVGNANLRLMNYLASVFSFLEHSENQIKKLYGENSINYDNFKKATKYAFDNYFSYRFLYHLRHYSQHCGMPIAGFSDLVPFNVNKINKTFSFRLVAYCDRDQLLSDKFNWHNQLKKEIPERPLQIDIVPHVNVMMNCIRDISRSVIKDELHESIKNIGFLLELMHPAKIRGTPYIYEIADSRSTTIWNVEKFPIHLIDAIYQLNNGIWKSLPSFNFKENLETQ